MLSSSKSSADELRQYTLSSAVFTLKSSKDLFSLKDFLSGKGYSEVNKPHEIRSCLVIEDASYLSTQSSMTQRVWYINHAFPIVYFAIEFLAGLIPYILIQVRKREIAVMRSLGASKANALFSMLFEQAMLCVVGLAAGIAVWLIFVKEHSPEGMALVGLYLICWLIGTSISARQINSTAVQSILKAEE
jgi:hypothetical protein